MDFFKDFTIGFISGYCLFKFSTCNKLSEITKEKINFNDLSLYENRIIQEAILSYRGKGILEISAKVDIDKIVDKIRSLGYVVEIISYNDIGSSAKIKIY